MGDIFDFEKKIKESFSDILAKVILSELLNDLEESFEEKTKQFEKIPNLKDEEKYKSMILVERALKSMIEQDKKRIEMVKEYILELENICKKV